MSLWYGIPQVRHESMVRYTYLRSNMSPKLVRERMKYIDNTRIINCGTDCVCVCVGREGGRYRR